MNETKDETMIRLLLLKDPITAEDLHIISEPKDNGNGAYSMDVSTSDGSRKWRHTVSTEEI